MEIRPRSSARLVTVSRSVPSMRVVSLPTMISRSAASRSACSGLKQITNRSSSAIRTSLTCRFYLD